MFGINGNVFKVMNGSWETKKQCQSGRLTLEDNQEKQI